MNLKKIFGSGARVKLMQQFLLHPEEEFYIRELTRMLDEQINSLRRELENLEAMGMLTSKEKNRKKFYTVNPHFIILNELTSIVRKTNKDNEALLKKIAKSGSIDLLMLGGAFIKDENGDVDIFIVGDIDKTELEEQMEALFPNVQLRYNSMKKEDFLYRIAIKDSFIHKLFEKKQNIILKNKLKKATKELIKA